MPACYSLIIPAYNEAQTLPDTLAAAREAMAQAKADWARSHPDLPPKHGQLIVVDNNSTDSTADVAREHGAEVVFEPVNQIGRARNAGAFHSQADWLIFVDADTKLNAALLHETFLCMHDPRCVGGGTHVAMDPPPDRINQAVLNLWNKVSAWRRWPAGCYFFCRHDTFDAVGGFDLRFYASEEVWLSKALQRHAQNPKAMVILDTPIHTSSRKCDNPWYAWRWVLFMLLCPFAVRFRSLCGFWYDQRQTSH